MPLHPAIRGRGARSNSSGRYEALAREGYNDGWDAPDDALPRQHPTTLEIDRARSLITFNDSPDLGFDRAINPYRGCEHGCIYCYARPTHAYLGHSPGLDFETRLYFKPDAPALLRQALAKPGYTPERIQLGSNTDPYQPVERKLRLTRGLLEVLCETGHPFGLTTKNALVARDADLLGPAGRAGLGMACTGVTSLDRDLARAMEPRASTPDTRLRAMEALAKAGAVVMVAFAPVIPGLNDHELEQVLARARDAGACCASYTVLRLPLEIKDLFREWLAEARPDRAARVMSLVRQMRGGKDYDAEWGKRMKGEGPLAALINRRFQTACERLGLLPHAPPMHTDLFRRSAATGQGDLFGA